MIKKHVITDQSHYREVPRWEIFYRTVNEIWAGFGPIGSTLGCQIDEYTCLFGTKET